MKAGWRSTPVGKVCTVIAGQSPEGQFYNAESDGLPFFQGKKDFQEKHIGEARVWTSKITKEAQPGDILMSAFAKIKERQRRIVCGRMPTFSRKNRIQAFLGGRELLHV